MKKIAVCFGAAAILASGAMAGPAQASTIVQDTINAVRDRVCVEEHGYGVVDCSQTIDPVVGEIGNTISPATDLVVEGVNTARETAEWAAENGPGIVKDEVNYVYCWMVNPTNPYCTGIIR